MSSMIVMKQHVTILAHGLEICLAQQLPLDDVVTETTLVLHYGSSLAGNRRESTCDTKQQQVKEVLGQNVSQGCQSIAAAKREQQVAC